MLEFVSRLCKRAAYLALWCVVAMPLAAGADTSGIISGTVTDYRTHVAIAGVVVVAKSPSATYRAVTDAHGRYSFLSVLPDNYSISFTHAGYAAYSAIAVVLNGSQQKVDAQLSVALRTIAHTRARSRMAGWYFHQRPCGVSSRNPAAGR